MDHKRSKSLTWILLALVLIGGAFFLFVEIADEVVEEETLRIDQLFIDFTSFIQSDGLDCLFSLITELGSVWFLTVGSIIVGVILLFYKDNRIWRFLYFAVTMIGIFILTTGLKNLFERERPNILEQYDGTGFSFPSGHSTSPIVFYGFIIYLIIRSRFHLSIKWMVGIVLILLILLIGFSRIYLGVHYASDVIGGFTIGFTWLMASIVILELIIRWKNKKG